MTWETVFVSLGIGLVFLSSILTYILMRMKSLERDIIETFNSIPTVEQMAKEVIKVQVPLSELPPEVVARLKANMTPIPEPVPVPTEYVAPPQKGKQDPVKLYTG